MSQFKYIILASLLLSACAQTPKQALETDISNHEETQEVTSSKLPNVELSSELLYEFMLSEVAGQRGELGLAAEASASLAKKTRDPRLAMRAAHIAVQSGQMDKALESLRIWEETDPDSLMAKRMLASVLLRTGKIGEAKDEMIKVLKADEAHAGQTIMQMFQMLANYPDKKAALEVMQEVATLYPEHSESHWAVAQLARAIGQDATALNEVRQARKLSPQWDMAVSLEAQLLQKKAPLEGLEVLRYFLMGNPDSRDIRLQYARTLLEQKQFKQARDQFQRLSDENPDNPEMAYAVALISLQLNDLPRAEKEFEESLDKGRKDRDTVQYYLGQLGEAKKNEDEAIEHYRQVNGGEYYFASKIRVVYLLSKHGKHEEALELLRGLEPAGDQESIQLVLVEAHVLRTANRYTEAYGFLKRNLDMQPDNPDLLYETAMMAEKNGKPDEFEAMMRKLIDIDPDRAHAYNALGYSFLERNVRIPEAMALVKKAIELSPDDPAIIDSMGWGHFLSGNLEDSLKLLRRAYSLNPDHEIAAHLGEVLWASGNQKEAKKIWQESLKDNPESRVLPAVMKRFMP